MDQSKKMAPNTDPSKSINLFEDRYFALGRATGSMVWRVGPTGHVADMPDWPDVTGQPIDESRNAGWLLQVHPDDRERTMEIWSHCLETQTPYEADYRLMTTDGDYRWFKARGIPILNEDGTTREWVGLCEDIHDRTLKLQEQEESKRALRESEDHYRFMVDTNPQMPWTADPSGAMTDFSDRWLEMTAISREETNGNAWLAVLHPDDIDRMSKIWRRCIETGEVYDVEHRARTADGTYRWMRSRAVPRKDNDGRIIRWYGSTEDIDKQKHVEANLEKLVAERTAELNEANAALTVARDAALAAAKTKSEFLANMSHEIRTPMNGVIGLTSLLLKKELEPDTREMVETISSSGDSLLRIIDDILDLSRIDAAKLEIERSTIDIDHLCSDVVALFQGHAGAKGVSLRCIPPHLPMPTVLADSVRLRQVLSNLISNGVKFTEIGEVTLGWNWTAEERGIQVSFLVADTGAGIPEDRTEAVFESFTQADGSTQRRFGGTGLGLTISKRLTELMGGRISVQSKVNAGTTFKVDLTFDRSDSWISDTNKPVEPESDPLVPIRVLLAEDNNVNVLVARRLLEHCGCSVDVAENGLRAIAMATSDQYDLILMDMHMPVCDGLEAAGVIRQHEERSGCRRLPIYALTANVMRGDREACIAAGMDGFLAKPIPLPALEVVVNGVRSTIAKG